MSFKDIKGQDIPISFLKRAVENRSLAHAYLFVGIDGIGKALVANTLAKALNCEKRSEDSCDICTSCRKIDAKNHPDIFCITPDEAQKTIKIESIRSIEARLFLRPYEAKLKVCIIEDAHFMTAEAANSLLKVLEEPPANSIFILTTSSISGLFPTIVSRCQVIKFSPLSPEIIENILIKKFGFRKTAARFISRFSEGGINRKAILQNEAFIDWKNEIINEFMEGSFYQEKSLMFSLSKRDLEEALSILINWYRDILVFAECSNISKASSASRRDSKEESFIRGQNNTDEASIINFDRIKNIKDFSKKLSYGDIDKRLNTLMDAYLAIRQNVNPKLVIGALV